MRIVFFCLALPIFFSTQVCAQSWAPLTPGFEREIKLELPELKFSGRIAFTTTIEGVERVLLLDLDTRRIRALIDGPGNSSYPNWSPDGSKLAFVSDRTGKRIVYLSDWNGENVRRASADHAGSEDHPSWSTKGDELIVTTDDGKNSGASNIARIALSTGALTAITKFGGRNTNPRWRPDGKAVTYSTSRFWPGWDLCTLTIDDNREKCFLTGSQSYCRAEWSHSGNRLAYSFGGGDDIDIGIHDATALTSTPIFQDEGKDYDATWSPDDRYLLAAHEDENSKLFTLYISDLKDPPKKFITSPYSIRYPTWTSARTIDLEARRILESEGLTPQPRIIPTEVPAPSSSSSSNSSDQAAPSESSSSE